MKNYYYFYEWDEFLNYLKKMYGEFDKVNKMKDFSGKVGIMIFIVRGREVS